MSVVGSLRKVSPEDLLNMPDGEKYELVDGKLVERNMGWKSSWVGGRLFHQMSAFCDNHPLGLVAPADASYQCFPNAPKKVRRADASFIRKERLPDADELEGHCRIAPDIVGEVVSPNDLYSEVEEKVEEYLEAGVRLVWVLNPPTRSIRVHRQDGTVTDLSENDDLSGEDVLPGFRCRVGDLFAELSPPPAP